MNTTGAIKQNLAMEMINVTQSGRGGFSPLLSLATLDSFLKVNLFVATIPWCSLGVFTNLANIIVYCKMSFSESANVNFLVLSVFDFILSMSSLFGRAAFSPLLRGLSVWPQILYFGHAISPVSVIMTCGSAMMTGLISMERCACVVFPLKVKTLLTRSRSLFLTLTVVVYHMAFLTLIFLDPGPPYDAHPPKKSFYYLCMYVIPSTTIYFIVVCTTIILVIKLRKSQKWRREAGSQAAGKSSDKEDKLIRTIIAICTLFIICSFPTATNGYLKVRTIYVTQIIYPRFSSKDPYFGTFVLLIFSLGFSFQAISSSVNIFFYYRLSSRYKKVFWTCILRRSENSDVEKKIHA